MNFDSMGDRILGRKLLGPALILGCLLLAAPPFFGFQYAFYVGGYDLAIFKSVAYYHSENPFVVVVFSPLLPISRLPSDVIAALLPIPGITVFGGEGKIAPKPMVTVVFWVMMAAIFSFWLRRGSKEQAKRDFAATTE